MNDRHYQTARHFYIEGRVQGVGYRASAAAKGRELGLTGWVKNLPDGRVECTASGPPLALGTFEHWLNEGPPAAAVKSVVVTSSMPDDSLPYPFQIHR